MIKPSTNFHRFPILLFLCLVLFNSVSANALSVNVRPGGTGCSFVNPNCIQVLPVVELPPVPFELIGGKLGNMRSEAALTDSYNINCSQGTNQLKAYVFDVSEKPLNPASISIQIMKGSGTTPLSVDEIDGDKTPGPTVSLKGGSGIYKLNVNKSATPDFKGIETYKVYYTCEVSSNYSAGSTLVRSQNQ